jgi:hypothetical protein
MANQQIVEQLEIIGNAVSNLDNGYQREIGFDVETFNMLAFTLGEIAENTKKIANALERMEEA